MIEPGDQRPWQPDTGDAYRQQRFEVGIGTPVAVRKCILLSPLGLDIEGRRRQ